ncbi:hypothetical protein LIER_00839 [Lithospermum erythrorhizon]|uniref:Trichome birefringence-like C-terminal domain-containing protein n=1 Tax=Lithospermum erythrorhizon TaxID=34254 RepID=A0AAV3NIW1_LITER
MKILVHFELGRFDAATLLQKLRGKRMVFVGDSLNRNQFVSLVCMVDSSIPPTLKSLQFNGNLIIFKAIEYNASIEFYWSPLLVESNTDDPINHRVEERIAKLDSIEKHAKHWIDAEVLVFDSYIWWLRPKMKVLWGSFGRSDGIYEEMERLKSYEMALNTWANWLTTHVDRDRTRLFFMSLSPMHRRAEDWGMDANDSCYNETDPIYEENYWGSLSNVSMMGVVESTIQDLNNKGLNIQLLNITQLSEYRKDGHPSIYRKQWVNLTEEQLANPKSYADCGHWCLPGVPDTWNQILFAYMFHSH